MDLPKPTKIDLFKCNSCGKIFNSKEYLKKHIHTVHEEHKDYKCKSCRKSFTGAKYLKNHIYRVHDDYECDNYDFEHVGISEDPILDLTIDPRYKKEDHARREDREDCSAFQGSSDQEIPSAPEALDNRIKELTPSATSVSTTSSIWPFARALGVVRG